MEMIYLSIYMVEIVYTCGLSDQSMPRDRDMSVFMLFLSFIVLREGLDNQVLLCERGHGLRPHLFPMA